MPPIADNVFLLSSLILSACGWLIAFIGACVFRRGLSGGAWWIVIYELLLVMGTGFVLLTNTFSQYRLVMLTFLATSIAMITSQLDYALPTTKFVVQYKAGAGAYAAGYIILIIIQFLWVLVFGSEADSYFGKYAPKYYGNTVGIVAPHNQPLQAQQSSQPQYEMTGDKTILTDSAAPYGTAYHATSPPTHPATAIIEPNNNNMSTEPTALNQQQIEYREKVQALHAYQANPEDPNELSFAKGEMLDIVDRNGNWWQARKPDGTVGIIPSNYFGASA
ncbi:hypothetical protein EDC94DRAFT_598580 [Helicostylum pulchrum]|nr:hypothetical protein EDC94DRAFT_598580 [Helicostylum pulchrum]